MATMTQHVPTDLTTVSRRSGFVMDADKVPLQNWIASQHARMTNRRPAARSLPSLKDVPYTAAEWQKTLAEIKRDYTNKRYRYCSTRCAELLKNAKTQVRRGYKPRSERHS